MSVAIILAFENSCAKVIAIHPEPVPISAMAPSLIVGLVSLSLYRCGPSEEEKAHKAYLADIKEQAAKRKAYLDATRLVFQEGQDELERPVADSSEVKKNVFVLANEYYSRFHSMDLAMKDKSLRDEWWRISPDATHIYKETGRRSAQMFISIAAMPQDKKSNKYAPDLLFEDDALVIGKARYILRAIQTTPEEIGYTEAKLQQMVLKYFKAQLAVARQLNNWSRMNLIIMDGLVNWNFTLQEMGITKAEIDSLEALGEEGE